MTFATATAKDRAKTRASWRARQVLAALVILAFIGGARRYFRGGATPRDPGRQAGTDRLAWICN
ncbi:MAG TPA: hypothetical protein VNT26_07300 [Candidatus Sulfotelmatobacter sp.]|nr:hypothetical protein [Candidatus Sulfotelmatobacter sp.]